MKFCKKILFLMISGILGIVVGACGKSVEVQEMGNELMLSEITAMDLEVIDYVNENSDYVFTLFDEMDITEKEPGVPYTEKSDDANVCSYGFFVEEKHAVIRTQISLNGTSDRNILGVHNGDTYKEARELIEKSGFTCVEKSSFNSGLMLVTYSKGVVEISMLVEIDENTDEIAEDASVNYINVTIPVDVGQKSDAVMD